MFKYMERLLYSFCYDVKNNCIQNKPNERNIALRLGYLEYSRNVLLCFVCMKTKPKPMRKFFFVTILFFLNCSIFKTFNLRHTQNVSWNFLFLMKCRIKSHNTKIPSPQWIANQIQKRQIAIREKRVWNNGPNANK